MLSKEDNELISRVGPGTVMGDFMRQYWLPFLYSWELEPDGAPQRVRLLGEDLIVFRDTNGQVGLLGNHCPHRGASLFFGRNEESGLRCVYHGWKFDVDGACVDMPNEPPESNFKSKVHATAYKCAEAGGMVWAYMGPSQANPPGVPQHEWTMLPETHVHHEFKHVLCNNWLQGVEGDIDSAHLGFLHNRELGDQRSLPRRDKAPKLEVIETDAGPMYGARRNASPGYYYWRTTRLVFPFHTLFAGNENGLVPCHIWVPIDDDHTLVLGVRWNPVTEIPNRSLASRDVGDPGPGPMRDFQTGKFFGNWWPVAAIENDFLIDRDRQRTQTFTGLPTVRVEDAAMTTSMGPIMDRSRERLGTTDMMIIRARRRYLAAARALREQGVTPPTVAHPEQCRVRSCAAILPEGVDWQTALADWHLARTRDLQPYQAAITTA